MTIEKGTLTWKEKKDRTVDFVQSHYKKMIWLFILSTVSLSFFFFDKTAQIVRIAPIEVFTYIFLAISLFAFFFRKKIESFFEEQVYSDSDYLDDFEEKQKKLSDKERSRAHGPSRPLEQMMFFINWFLWLNFILFLTGKAIGSFLGYNMITSPIAVLCVYGQMYLAYKTIQLVGNNVKLFIKLKSSS